DCLRVKSYHGGTVSTGRVEFDHAALPEIDGRHVLLLDDILDSGHTLAAIIETIRSSAHPLSLKSCVLLRKLKERSRPLEADYVRFDIEDEFVVGYGLDYREQYRNLPLRRFGDLSVLIRIQFFSLLRDLKGPNSVEIPEGSTVADLLKTLFE